MKKKIDLNRLGRSRVKHYKELHLESEKDGIGVYTIHHEFPIRWGYDDNKQIVFIDFDEGPFLTLNSKVYDYKLIRIDHDENFNNVRIVLKDENISV